MAPLFRPSPAAAGITVMANTADNVAAVTATADPTGFHLRDNVTGISTTSCSAWDQSMCCSRALTLDTLQDVSDAAEFSREAGIAGPERPPAETATMDSPRGDAEPLWTVNLNRDPIVPSVTV
jgi:hypothetical protein